MPTKGQIVTNPFDGISFEYLETAKDTNGECVVMKVTILKKGQPVPNHIHTIQDETFEVTSGKLTVWENGETKVLSAGERITLAKN